MRGKCERGRGSANADGGSVNAGAEVQTRTGRVRKSSRAMGTRRRRLSAPWPRFHGADRPDVYIIIHVRACCCGECALNPPTSQPIPSRRPSLAPAQRHALAEHFRSPTQPRRTPAGCATHSPPTSPPIPRRRPSLLHAQRHALPEHFRSPTQPRRTPTQCRRTPAGCAMHARRPHNSLPAEDLRSPPQPRRTPAGCAMHARRPHHPFPAEDLRSLPHSDTPSPSTSAPTQRRRTPTQSRTAPAGCAKHSPQRHAASPSVPLRAQKKRHRTVHVRCRMSRSTVVAVGHLGW